jgi:hypothetical protein
MSLKRESQAARSDVRIIPHREGLYQEAGNDSPEGLFLERMSQVAITTGDSERSEK